MNIIKFENKIIDFIVKKIDVIFLVIMTLFALTIRCVLFPIESDDYKAFLAKWMSVIDGYGGIQSLGYTIGNYNVPYMVFMAIFSYLPVDHIVAIKATSTLFDVVLAIGSALIVGEVLKKSKNVKFYKIITYLIVLFMPTVILNSSYWGQCDSIYSAFAILSIYFLLKDKTILSFILLGVAFAFKLQTIFLLPLFIILYLSKRNFSIVNFLIIPLVNIILCLPAVIMGRGFIETMRVYFNQTEYTNLLTMNMPNMYMFIDGPYWLLDKFGIILTIVIFGFLTYYVLRNKVKWDSEKILVLALISVLVCNYFLPHMHERYLFLADIISVIWFICYRKKLYVPIIINFISFTVYINYFGEAMNGFDWRFISILFAFVMIVLVKYFIGICKKDGGQ